MNNLSGIFTFHEALKENYSQTTPGKRESSSCHSAYEQQLTIHNFEDVENHSLLEVDNLLQYNVKYSGEGEIRTLGTRLTYSRFPGDPDKPLLHLSKTWLTPTFLL
jgi:hypothetical protein